MSFNKFCKFINSENLANLKKIALDNFENFGVYPDSIQEISGTYFFIAKNDAEKSLILFGDSSLFSKFEGEEISSNTKVCKLNNKNCNEIRKLFPFTNPVSHKGKAITMGFGDRLGASSAGHIRVVKGTGVFPILAQQSMRELNLTGRNYEDVLSAACWAVFQEGYTEGFGADGDHLKTHDEVKYALSCGFTMITLDCSEHIDNNAANYSDAEINENYAMLSEADKERLLSVYSGKEFAVAGTKLYFPEIELKRIALVYLKAIKHTISIFNELIKTNSYAVDFEVSIDETLSTTTPEAHFLVASELIHNDVEISSVAPRFCGEFQKGIDYIGQIPDFKSDFTKHYKIAEKLGYKVSVHSGSDKFNIFPIVGEVTGGKYHLKTAGTNWLEAVRVIAQVNPALYRKMHKFAMENVEEAKKYYHIKGVVSNVKDIDGVSDSELPSYMNEDDARQIIHITYGLLLQAKDDNGNSLFADEFFSTLNKYEADYYAALDKHIGRHLKLLGIK